MNSAKWLVVISTAFGLLVAILIVSDVPSQGKKSGVVDQGIEAFVDESAPDFELVTLTGASVSLRDLRGKIVFLNFWATWCIPCRAEMPAFEDYVQANGDEQVVILTVNVGESSGAAQGFLDEFGVNKLRVALDRKSQVKDLYGVQQLPTTFIIDQNGVVRSIRLGEMKPDDLISYVDFLQRNPT